jgi:SAM-dependent methyltransferase
MDPTKRFSSRVENYIKYRPGYPPALIELLQQKCGLTSDTVVADVGSGTGVFTELLLKAGCTVFGVEPNLEMRKAAERRLAGYRAFKSVPGTAEATGLQNHCLDIITAGQAFHWFDREKTRVEFQRILKTEGWVVMFWNDRRTDSHPFLTAYENFLNNFGTDYQAVNHKRIDATVMRSFFGPNGFSQVNFHHQQVFDFEGLKGRLLSSSYAPDAGHPGHHTMLDALRVIFDEYQENGKVVFEYDTTVFHGRALV